MQIVSLGDDLHGKSSICILEKIKISPLCLLLNLPQDVKHPFCMYSSYYLYANSAG